MKRGLLQDFILHYEAGSREGGTVLCGRGAEGAMPGLLYTQLIRNNFMKRKPQDRDDIITLMMKGFAILELICVNLFLYPWRKEIRTLKKFTGNFVYFVEPVIPEKIVRQILQRVGYSIVKETEYVIGGTINVEEAKLAAFELYLARLYCEKLLCLTKENGTDCADLLFTEIKSDTESSEQCRERSSQIADTRQTDSPNHLNMENIHRKDSKKSTAGCGLPTALHYTRGNSTDLYSRNLDSDEFLNKYSDLNLAQQPLLPLQSRKTNILPQEVSKERFVDPKFAKPCILDSSSNGPQPDLCKDLLYNIPTENSDPTTTILSHNTLDSKKPLDVNKSSVDINMPNKSTQSERLVIKLKMGKSTEEMGYPIEETSPPDPKEFSSSTHYYRDPKWTCLKNKETTEEVNSPASLSSGFSMINGPTSKGAECAGVDNLHQIREPPSSMYIPPGGTERQCLRITELQPEESHYQVPSVPGDMVQVNETLYNVHEDTQEDFVMITKESHT